MASISGKVFNDLNHNGKFDTGEPGIVNVFIVLYDGVSCTTQQTDGNGNYSFSGIGVGNYTIYEPVADPVLSCPPTYFTQPSGYTVSNGARKRNITITADGDVIIDINFSHEVNTNTVSCTTQMIQIAGAPSRWFDINLVTGTSISRGTFNPSNSLINAIGYNLLDNFIYGYEQNTDQIIRVDNARVATTLLPRPTGLPISTSLGTAYNVGNVNINGFFYIYHSNDARFYTIDVRPNSATYLKLVDPGNGYQEQTSNFGTLLQSTLDIRDWDYYNNYLYTVNGNGYVVRINPANGNVLQLTTNAKLPAGQYGAIGIDGNGYMYAILNATGVVYRIIIDFVNNIATTQAFSQSAAATSNDGTMCPAATLEIDFGDAPDTSASNSQDDYSTLLAHNGPRHQIINVLTLGTKITAELDAYQSPDALGDDKSVIPNVQDDGLTVPLTALIVKSTTYNYILSVAVTNNTGNTARLYGWIDFNQNGVFNGNEAAVVVNVPSALGLQQVNLSFTVPANIPAGHTFVRLRLTTDSLTNVNSGNPTLEDTRSVGPASDGEVEDYYILVDENADVGIQKNTIGVVVAGSQVTYGLVITNTGPSSANNVVINDVLDSRLQSPQVSLDGGLTWNAWTGSINLGTVVANGGPITVRLRGTLDASATGNLINTATVTSSTPDPNPDNNTSTVTDNISLSADVYITKQTTSPQVIAGSQVVYSLIVGNLGPSDAQNVMINDTLSNVVTNGEYSLDGGLSWLIWNGTLSLGTVAPSVLPITLLIRGDIDSGATGNLTNTANVYSTTPDPNLDNNTSTVIDSITTSADLWTKKLNTSAQVVAGTQIQYSLQVGNFGPSDAQQVEIQDILPAEIVNGMYSLDGGQTWQIWNGSINIGTLNANETFNTILLKGMVSSAALGILTNIGSVTSVTPDPNLNNNTSVVVNLIDTSADVFINKTTVSAEVVAGNEVIYGLNIGNLGPSDAQSVIVSDTLPPMLQDGMYSLDGGITWNAWSGSINLGIVTSGGSNIAVLVKGILVPAATGELMNTATALSVTPDPNQDNNTSSVTNPINLSADVAITKTNISGVVVAGSEIRYNLMVTNLGPSDAQSVVVSDEVPTAILNPSYSLDGGNTWSVWTGSIDAGTLLVGAAPFMVQIKGIVDASATGNLTNTASVISTTPDPDLNNNTDTVTAPITTLADLYILKSNISGQVIAGEVIQYSLLIGNLGPSDAQSITVEDMLSPDISNPFYSVDNGTTWQVWLGTLSIETMVVGVQQTIYIKGIVNPAATGSLINLARITSTTPDPNPNNNTATQTDNISISSDVAVFKVGEPNPVNVGGQITYTITVTNNGPSNAQGVVLTDEMHIEP